MSGIYIAYSLIVFLFAYNATRDLADKDGFYVAGAYTAWAVQLTLAIIPAVLL